MTTWCIMLQVMKEVSRSLLKIGANVKCFIFSYGSCSKPTKNPTTPPATASSPQFTAAAAAAATGETSGEQAKT